MKVRSTSRLLGATAAIFAGLTLAACGGGGGGSGSGGNPPVSSPPPPPPPPPANVAPTARATATPASPQEGQPFSLDASASTDPEGAALTYAWSQISGPPVTLANPNQAVLQLAAAEVTEDTDAIFRVAVSDGTNTSTTDVSIAFVNIAQTPTWPGFNSQAYAVGRYSREISSITYYDVSLGYSGVAVALVTDDGEGVEIFKTDMPRSGGEMPTTASPVLDRVFDRSIKLIPFYTTKSPFSLGVGILDEAANSIQIFSDPGDQRQLSLDKALSVQSPCGTSISIGRLVGQRELGATGYEASGIVDFLGTDIEPGIQIQNGQSLCHLMHVSRPVGDVVFNFINDETARPILAYNSSANTVDVFRQVPGTHVFDNQYYLTQSVPVLLKSDTPLSVVDSAEIQLPSGNVGMALVFTDGEHEGNHRLLVTGLDADYNVLQEVYSWPIGVPGAIIQESFDNDSIPEFVIVSPTSPQAIIFEVASMTGNQPNQLVYLDVLKMDPPYFAEIGLGASMALTHTDRGPELGTIIAYPKKGEVKFFTRPRN